jgi:hypothetical protein
VPRETAYGAETRPLIDPASEPRIVIDRAREEFDHDLLDRLSRLCGQTSELRFEHVAPSRRGRWSRGLESHVQEFGRRLTMFELFSDHPQRQCLNRRDGCVTILAVAHHARQCR